MKRALFLAVIVLSVGSVLAADPKEELAAATRKVVDAGNYSWKQTMETFAGSRSGFVQETQEGQALKNGLTHMTLSSANAVVEALRKGTNGVLKEQTGDWQTYREVAAANVNAGSQVALRLATQAVVPMSQVADLMTKVKDLSLSNGVFAGDFTADAARPLLGRVTDMIRGGGMNGGGGGNTPTVSDAIGTVKFWVAEGGLNKYELSIRANVSYYGGRKTEVGRITTVEFKEVGTTKINAPADALKKID